jgi:anti-sigma regulatory factor (Ser/Thr protein kinase)
MAADHGFDETAIGQVAVVVTEAATNLVKHAGGGEILLQPVVEGDEVFIEVLALDKAGGMRNIAECQRDGYSTSGSPGTGLGSIARLSAFCDIYSQPERGTALLARVSRRRGQPVPAQRVGGLAVAMPGETACGDAWDAVTQGTELAIAVVDGLGHGPLAAEAAAVAVRAFQMHTARPPRTALQAMHAALRGTRGAAAAVATLDEDRHFLTFAGVGNIAASVLAGGTSRSLVSHNGIVGQALPTPREFTCPWPPGALLVMHSDGVTAHWKLEAYPGLGMRHPSLIAGVIYRDFSRDRDDATVVVARGGAR